MNKIAHTLTFVAAIALLGGGCTSAPQNQNPRAAYDANYFKMTPSSSIPLGPSPGFKPADPAPPTTTNPNPTSPESVGDGSTTLDPQPPKNTVVNQTKTPPPLAYNDALNVYRNKGAYIQFSQCRGNPGSLSIKKSTKIMLDNRDSVARTFVLGNYQYNIARYGFVIADVPQYPGTYYVTCNGGGSAAVKVQN